MSNGPKNTAKAVGRSPKKAAAALVGVIGSNPELTKVAGFGVTVLAREQIRRRSQALLHDRLGYRRLFGEINSHIDRARGRNHRLKAGHSIDEVPGLVVKYGPKAIPAWAFHLLQDSTTLAGVPFLPRAYLLKIGLQKLGFSATAATSCVTVNLAGIIGVIGTAVIVWEIGKCGYRIYKSARKKHQLKKQAEVAA